MIALLEMNVRMAAEKERENERLNNKDFADGIALRSVEEDFESFQLMLARGIMRGNLYPAQANNFDRASKRTVSTFETTLMLASASHDELKFSWSGVYTLRLLNKLIIIRPNIEISKSDFLPQAHLNIIHQGQFPRLV